MLSLLSLFSVSHTNNPTNSENSNKLTILEVCSAYEISVEAKQNEKSVVAEQSERSVVVLPVLPILDLLASMYGPANAEGVEMEIHEPIVWFAGCVSRDCVLRLMV